MSNGSSHTAYVNLRPDAASPGPFVVPLEALRLLWALEDRGCAIRADGADLWVAPSERLSDRDRSQIRQWKPYLVALVRYTPQAGAVGPEEAPVTPNRQGAPAEALAPLRL